MIGAKSNEVFPVHICGRLHRPSIKVWRVFATILVRSIALRSFARSPSSRILHCNCIVRLAFVHVLMLTVKCCFRFSLLQQRNCDVRLDFRSWRA